MVEVGVGVGARAGAEERLALLGAQKGDVLDEVGDALWVAWWW